MKMFKKQIATAILLVAGLFSSSYLFSQNEDKTLDPNDYGGICCDNFGNVCWHPNGMVFLGAKWYSGGPYCQ
ncbi:hypothetical protein [uncultured Marivirga sp.]|uniref:hypothetical protein n=1 Tax=uncultured Marivirga sp. TaxID=1123707 RepID=UPI0030ECB0C6|tara:strand:- start:460154 stop:460369 length:216 start_codon:yes stop_codon:yes gene_type:complete